MTGPPPIAAVERPDLARGLSADQVALLQVIVANEQFLQARLGYAQAVAARLQDTVALYVALGGGWWNAPL